MRAISLLLLAVFLTTFIGCKTNKQSDRSGIRGTLNRDIPGFDRETPGSKGPTGPGADLTNGTGSRGGSDNVTLQQKSAWFLGADKKIDICINAADGFTKNVTLDTIKTDIQWAFDQWIKYINDKKLNELSPYSASVVSENLSQNLVTQYEIHDSCDDNENIDLTFYFGVQPEETTQPQSAVYETAAAAVRIEYDEEQDWGRGYIWFSEPKEFSVNKDDKLNLTWTEPVVFRSHLLHEIGHTYGIDDIKGTVMEEKSMNVLLTILSNLQKNQGSEAIVKGLTEDLEQYLYIDRSKELYPCVYCTEMRYWTLSEIPVSILFEDMPEPINGYQISDARVPHALIKEMEMSFDDSNQDTERNFYTLKFIGVDGDQTYEWNYELSLHSTDTYVSSGIPIFITWKASYFSHSSQMQFGYLIGKDGKKAPILLERNFNHMYPLRLNKSRSDVTDQVHENSVHENIFEGFFKH